MKKSIVLLASVLALTAGSMSASAHNKLSGIDTMVHQTAATLPKGDRGAAAQAAEKLCASPAFQKVIAEELFAHNVE